MLRNLLVASGLVLSLNAVTQVDAQTVPCPTTASFQRPELTFTLPAPYDRLRHDPGYFWHGTPVMWTRLSVDGRWQGLYRPDLQSFRNKLFIWRPGYDWSAEPSPPLIVTSRRLDGPAPPVTVDSPTHAMAENMAVALLTAVNIPTWGCWELTARYAADTLTFVVTVP